MTNGIVLMAFGDSHYGRMAYNLALTIRLKTDIPIHLVFEPSAITHLTEEHMRVFSSFYKLDDPSYFTVCGKKNYAYPKLFLYDLSPFDNTLFLDVDTAWCGNGSVENIFEEYSKQDFIIKNRNYYDFKTKETSDGQPLWFWVDEKEVAKAHALKFGRLYSVHAEFIYFKKTDSALVIFEAAKLVANKPLVESFLKWSNQNNVDEVPISISMAINKTRIPSPINPTHWYQADGIWIERQKLFEDFSLLSTGGNRFPKYLACIYNDLVNYAAQELKMPNAFPHEDKKNYLPERQTI